MSSRVRPYLFYDVALTICSTCFRKLEGKIVFEQGRVFLLKDCPQHGPEKVLVADDVDYYRRCREVFIKPPEMPRVQHADALGLPVRLRTVRGSSAALVPFPHRNHRPLQSAVPRLLRAERSVERQQFRTLEHVQGLIDAVVRNEGRAGRRANLGRRAHAASGLLRDPRPARRRPHPAPDGEHQRHPHRHRTRTSRSGWPTTCPDFEVYLQFDSLEAPPLWRCGGRICATCHQTRSTG